MNNICKFEIERQEMLELLSECLAGFNALPNYLVPSMSMPKIEKMLQKHNFQPALPTITATPEKG